MLRHLPCSGGGMNQKFVQNDLSRLPKKINDCVLLSRADCIMALSMHF